MNQLHILKLRFTLKALRRYTCSGNVGNRIRGAFGRASAYLYCSGFSPDFNGCTCNPPCIYGEVFKPVKTHPEFTTLLSPFVLSVSGMGGERIEKGELCHFSFSLFGKCTSYWQEVIEAFKAVFGSSERVFVREEERLNDSFELLRVESALDGTTVYEAGRYIADPYAAIWSDANVFELMESGREEDIELDIKFASRLLLKNEEYANIDFSKFMDYIMLRLSGMVDLYEGGHFAVPYGLLYRKPKVDVAVKERGELHIRFRGAIAAYLPYIEAGAQLHVGKNSTCGFGEYQYEIL